jgi:Methionyl-tRNA formyltransferase
VKDGQATQLKVFFGEKRSDLHAAPGTVLSDGKTYLAIATQDGALALTDVQLAGKKRMDIKAFLLGFRDPETYTTSKGTSKAEIDKTKPVEE